MTKFASFHYHYTLVVLDSNEERITALVSCHDLARTRRLAQSALRLKSKAAFVDISPYAPRVEELEGQDAVEWVSLDDEVAQEV